LSAPGPDRAAGGRVAGVTTARPTLEAAPELPYLALKETDARLQGDKPALLR